MVGPVTAATGICVLSVCHVRLGICLQITCFSPCLWQFSPTLYVPLAVMYSQITKNCTVLQCQPSHLPCLLTLQRDCLVWDFEFLPWLWMFSLFQILFLQSGWCWKREDLAWTQPAVLVWNNQNFLYLFLGCVLWRYGSMVKPFFVLFRVLAWNCFLTI